MRLLVYIFTITELWKYQKSSTVWKGELEITDLHNWYLERGELKVDIVAEWIDAGTFESLLKANLWASRNLSPLRLKWQLINFSIS